MFRKVLFVISHLYSGSDEVVDQINLHPRIDIKTTNIQYSCYQDLTSLLEMPHKEPSVSAVYGDHLLKNDRLCSRWFYDKCKFLYVVHSPLFSLNQMLPSMREETALNYYAFRLQRIREMIGQTKDSFLIIDQQPIGQELLHKFLEIKSGSLGEISLQDVKLNNNLSKLGSDRAENIYNNFFFRIKKYLS